MTAYDTFEKIVEQCFDFDSERSIDTDIKIKMKIENISEFLIENKPELVKKFIVKGYISAIFVIREYLMVRSFSFEGHARLREMVMCMSEYMDRHDEPKGENFNKIYKEFVEMVKPDGRSNAEEYYKTHDTTKYEDLVIRNIENALVGVEINIRDAFRLSNELGTKNDEYTMEKIKEKIQQRLDYIYNKKLEEKVYGE